MQQTSRRKPHQQPSAVKGARCLRKDGAVRDAAYVSGMAIAATV
jgi:hypothetical protein